MKTSNSSERAHPRRRRRLLRLVLPLLVVLGVAIWLLPQLALVQPVRGWLVTQAFPDLRASVDFRDATLGWFAPVEVHELSISDEYGDVITVNRITTTRTLLEMVSNPSELGMIRLEAPVVHVMLTPDGQNNLENLMGEDVFNPSKGGLPAASQASNLKLEVTDGRLIVTDENQGREFVAENTSVRATLPADAGEPVSVQVSAIALDGGQEGSLHAQLNWWQPATGQRIGQGDAQIRAEQFPITLATAIAAAAGVEVQGSGIVDATVRCEWQERTLGLFLPVEARVTGKAVQLMLPQLKGDVLGTQALEVDLNAVADSGKLKISQLRASSDLGTLEAKGEAPLKRISAPAHQGVIAAHHLEVKGFIDLAQLAAQMPHTLQLREDAVITDGQAEMTITSAGEEGRHAIQGRLTATQLAGTVSGRPVAWSDPLTIELKAAREQGALAIERAVCEAPFGTIQVTGDPTTGNFMARSDLATVVSELGQFIDLGDLQLNGTAETHGTWQLEGEQLTIHLDGDCRDLSVSQQGRTWLSEPQLAAQADLRMMVEGKSIRRIDSGMAQLTAGNDQVLVRLQQGVDTPGADAVWPLKCRVTGNVANWARRVAPEAPWRVSGDARIEAEGWVSAGKIEIPSFEADVDQFVASTRTTRVQEPKIQLQGSLRADYETGHFQLEQLRGTSSILGIHGQDVQLMFPDGHPALSGVIAFRGDTGRLYALINPTSPQRATGSVEGQLSLTRSEQVIRVDGTVQAQDFAYFAPAPVGPTAGLAEVQPVGREQLIWQETSLSSVVAGTWDPVADEAKLDRLQVTGDEGTLDLQGTISDLTTQPNLALQGQLQYDLQRVSQKLNRERPSGIQVTGQHQTEVRIDGPLFQEAVSGTTRVLSPELHAITRLAWDRADVFGLLLGPQQLDLELRNGVLATSPIHANVAGGQLTARPTINFQQQPLAIDLAGETVLQNAHVTPEACSQWLKYVAPLVSGAATASGDFTVVLDQAHIPLQNPRMAELAGRFLVGRARVQPGSFARHLYTLGNDLTSLLAQSDSPFPFMSPDQSWVELSNQEVDFQMTQGRIYHQNLNMVLGDVTIASRGWVGLDHTVAMVAEIPMQAKWLGSSPLLDGLRGRSIQIPIHGTLGRPHLDRSGIRQLSSQLIGNTAERLIDGQLQRGLQKLLGPK